MKYKISLLFDSFLTSGTNFIVTFLLLKYQGPGSVVSFGVAMTISLIMMSFQRAIILIPFNLNGNSSDKRAILEFVLGTLYLLLVATSFVLLYLFFFDSDKHAFFISVSLLFFIFSHECLRYLLMTTKLYWVAGFTSFVFFLCVAQLFIFSSVDLILLSISYAGVFVLEVIIIACFSYSRNYVDNDTKTFDSLYWFRNRNDLISRNIQSLSQLFLVHSPFLLASALFPASLTALLFVARSLFQPVQIVVKSIESIAQRKAPSGINEIKKYATDFRLEIAMISTIGVIVCFLLAMYILPKFYLTDELPTTFDLILWGGVMVLLSISRSYEMFFIKVNMYCEMNFSYMIAGFIVGGLLLLDYYVMGHRLLSLYIFSGWFLLVIIQSYLFRTMVFHD